MSLLTAQDVATRGLVVYDATASANAAITIGNGLRIRHIALIPGSTTSTLLVYDAATATGTPKVRLAATLNGNADRAFFDPAGIRFSVGVSTTLAGTGAAVQIFYWTED